MLASSDFRLWAGGDCLLYKGRGYHTSVGENMHLPMYTLHRRKYTSLGKIYISGCESPRRPCVLKSRTEGEKCRLCGRRKRLQQVKHQQIPRKTLCLEELERVSRHVAYTRPARSVQQSGNASFFFFGRRASGKSKNPHRTPRVEH